MKIDIVSVFPEYFEVMNLSLMGKAQAKGLLDIKAHNLRDWTHDVHHSVDDTPVGGGAGMVMKPEVWGECLDELLGLSQQSDSVPAPGIAADSDTDTNQSDDPVSAANTQSASVNVPVSSDGSPAEVTCPPS